MVKELDDKLVLEIFDITDEVINKCPYSDTVAKSREVVNERLNLDFTLEEFDKLNDCLSDASAACVRFGLETKLPISQWRDKYFCNVFFRKWYEYLYKKHKNE